ncbi:MAG TPA: adenylyltransferase/cytidyltransferase family protein [Candidatus Saccharimonadales bacterium]|nr:adenylyltransferase/cytidyltransferase family protein [Candidatus Saccharimonadales bacterium]
MKVVIVSGYFNPLHGGHLDMIEAARALGDKLVVIVNNDQQQLLKKGKIILDEQNRMRLIRALRDVDEVVLSVDEDAGQAQTLRKLREMYPHDELIFANGGDRDPNQHALPESELQATVDCHIQTVFGVGSHSIEKRDSSSRINQATGHEVT